jgi:hypothetical protein
MAQLEATDEQTLTDALAMIARGAVSCDMKLDSVPPDLTKLSVFFNDALPALPKTEWEYVTDTHTVRFLGARCEAIQAGQVTDIDIVFGCPEPIIE